MRRWTDEQGTVFLIACAQALFQTSSVMVITLSGLVGLQLAPDKSLATLPIALMLVAAAATMIPAALLMQRFGRRFGFRCGAILGACAGLTAASAIWLHSFPLFVAANMLVGSYSGFAQYYRFAAADVASDAFRSRAISWVVAGGVVAAIAGPAIARNTLGLGSVPFLVSYLALTGLALIALIVIARLQLPAPISATAPVTGEAARPLGVILRQPRFLTALTASTVGYASMSMIMTATPLAMQLCGQPVTASATVIQWHVLGMFVPSFFTGKLIHRYGVLTVMSAGIALLCGHIVIALSGSEFLHFVSGLTLLGVGWNFLFIGGTTLLTQTYRPSEKAKTQAAHDFIMFGITSLASFSAGSLINRGGWDTVNVTAIPLLVLAALVVGGLWLVNRQSGGKN